MRNGKCSPLKRKIPRRTYRQACGSLEWRQQRQATTIRECRRAANGRAVHCARARVRVVQFVLRNSRHYINLHGERCAGCMRNNDKQKLTLTFSQALRTGAVITHRFSTGRTMHLYAQPNLYTTYPSASRAVYVRGVFDRFARARAARLRECARGEYPYCPSTEQRVTVVPKNDISSRNLSAVLGHVLDSGGKRASEIRA